MVRAVVVVLSELEVRTDVWRVDGTVETRVVVEATGATAVVAGAVAVAVDGDAAVFKVEDAKGVPAGGGALW